MVSIATVATWHTWTADFWADFKQRDHRQGNKRAAKRLWGCVNAKRQHSNTCCSFWYRKTFYYSDRNTVLPFLLIRQHKLRNDAHSAQLRIATVTRFSW